jgi:hypothetical protein
MKHEDSLPNDRPADERRRGAQAGTDRRKRVIPVAVERRSGIDRRKELKEQKEQFERRRQVDPTTCEKDYSDD